MQENREVLKVRDWVPVMYSDVVESTIVSAWLPIAGGRSGNHVKW